MSNLTGKVALVSGSGRGIGRAIALKLARHGARVVVNDLDKEPGEAVVAEIKAAGGEAAANYASVAEEKPAASIVETAMDTWGRIDILVNNAGILRDKAFVNMPMEDFEAVVRVHLLGNVYPTKAAWPFMRAAKYGRIVVTTSGSGTVGNFGQTNYGAAKMGVNGFINCLKHEGAKYNILCNAISPAARTRMTEAILPPDMLDYFKPELVSPAVAYLCSEECSFSGEIIAAAAGGYSRVKYVQSEGAFFDPAEPVTVEMFADALPKVMDMEHPQEHAGGLSRLENRLRAMGRIK